MSTSVERAQIQLAKEQAADKYGTHWSDCWKSHPRCLTLMLALRLEQMMLAVETGFVAPEQEQG